MTVSYNLPTNLNHAPKQSIKKERSAWADSSNFVAVVAGAAVVSLKGVSVYRRKFQSLNGREKCWPTGLNVGSSLKMVLHILPTTPNNSIKVHVVLEVKWLF